jgi:hypothetical protein
MVLLAARSFLRVILGAATEGSGLAGKDLNRIHMCQRLCRKLEIPILQTTSLTFYLTDPVHLN